MVQVGPPTSCSTCVNLRIETGDVIDANGNRQVSEVRDTVYRAQPYSLLLLVMVFEVNHTIDIFREFDF